MKKNLSIIMLVLLGLAWYVTLSSWLGNEEKYNQMIAEAQRLEGKGQYLNAIAQYEEAKRMKGGILELEEYIADDYLAMGDYKAYRTKLNGIIDAYGPVEADVVKLYDFTRDYFSEGTLIDLVQGWYERYPDNETVLHYYDGIKGKYTERICAYDKIDDFTGAYAVYIQNRKKGLIDIEGEPVIEAVYDEIVFDGKNSKMISVKDGDVCFFVNDKGYRTEMPEESYESLGIVSQGRIVAKKNGKYGYLDAKFNEKTEFIYDAATPFYEGTGAVRQGEKWALINKDGELTTEFIFDEVLSNSRGICSVNKRIAVKQGKAYFFVNEKGERVSEQDYDGIKTFEGDGMCTVCRQGKWGFADQDGSLIIDYIYEDAKPFTNGYAAVCKNGVWGYIDTKNYMTIQPCFDGAGLMTPDGTAPVCHGSTWTLIQLKVMD